jgi:hypothetical protein
MHMHLYKLCEGLCLRTDPLATIPHEVYILDFFPLLFFLPSFHIVYINISFNREGKFSHKRFKRGKM